MNLGQVFTTPTVAELVQSEVSKNELFQALDKHQKEMFGHLSPESKEANELAISNNYGLVLSEIHVSGQKLWISTQLAEHETYTTVMYPSEY